MKEPGQTAYDAFYTNKAPLYEWSKLAKSKRRRWKLVEATVLEKLGGPTLSSQTPLSSDTCSLGETALEEPADFIDDVEPVNLDADGNC